MRPQKFAALLALVAVSGVTCASSAVKVFDFEISGAPLPELARCNEPVGKPVKRLCTSSRPLVSKDGSVFDVRVPNAQQLPAWAEFAGFQLGLDANRKITEIEVKWVAATQKHEAAQSITKRFGLPVFSNLQTNSSANGAVWETPDIVIDMACGSLPSETCSIRFRARAVHDAMKAAREEKANSRKPL